MAKTFKKLLLAGLSTTRAVKVEGTDSTENSRVRFKAGQVVELTEEEHDLLVALEKSTGVAHFRDPIREGAAEAPEVVDVPDYFGEDVAIADKTVPQLKAFLDFHSVKYAGNASGDALRKLAVEKQTELDKPAEPATGTAEGSEQDNGL